ncbi:hypothetical protein [Sphingomonas mali]|uniref:hypothetical protein n=1 Tax=Sphingomonas mali TaxID=40682 RepID=UPI001FDFDC43|nr:hypothetical protein [Sphingomonas mali]
MKKGVFAGEDMEVGAAQADLPNMDQRLAGSGLRFIPRDNIQLKRLMADNGAHNSRPLLDSAIA